ncbi:ABC transporter substrate-binding protein [Nioella sp.]|uniref:ABC transporter substrate-binding protein n=1 Tax=Nioella sp. TaxID=1912091 RepID=UPI003511A65D
MKYLLSVSLIALGGAAWADCPVATVADMMGLEPGAYPQQYDLSDFEALAGCEMSFQENPEIAALNARIQGNPTELPGVEDRLPAEPLVVLPYETIGQYGGTLDGMSNATEAGTSDMLSLRHVNLVRFADDLVTIVPNVARAYEWNEDFTQLTFHLRPGHRWSDGAPFTAHDIAFWYNHMVMDPNVVESPRSLWMADGEPFEVEAMDDTTVVFRLPSPLPGLLASFAADFAQPFQPMHFLGQFHPAIDENADANAQALGFENGYAAIAHYYGGSDWKDVPSPLLRDPSTVESLPAAVLPTLEAFITVEDTTEGRHYVANPFFHMVDTAGNQLPYISEMDERYVSDNEVRILRMVNGEIDYKAQSVTLPDAPTLLDGAEAGNYTIDLRPQIGLPVFGFNVTAEDEDRRAIFLNRDFRLAMSHAINREEINSVAFFDLGEPRAYMHFDPVPPFATEDQATYATAFDPEMAAEMLDAVGLADSDGNGVRELNGEPFTLNLQFSTQGLSTAVAELVAQHWTDAGIPTTIREVTSDEYRSAQAANELDVIVWTKGQPIPIVLGSAEQLVPPFGGFFDARVGMLWSRYIETNGAEGIEPPAWTGELAETVAAWQQLQPGSAESNELGQQIIQQIQDGFMFIGTVQAPNPVYHSNALQNFMAPQTWSYEYYRMYPYRPQQWWLDE